MSGGARQGRGSGRRGVALEETGRQLADILRRALAVRVAKLSDRASAEGAWMDADGPATEGRGADGRDNRVTGEARTDG
ncbi:hypothetical protein QWE_16403 [Agrobacterium albertimagni AOL15]|uniref:Uncharacterized protein n=1 Tax=Agrobacterium albertimagni AOL15 TaxID=1156935 RepID=K2QAY9_9HYPH|nr:hypothetical protein QWE_16403 [Agrobacterium albertimagni AOL15]